MANRKTGRHQIDVEIIIRAGCKFSKQTLAALLSIRDQFPEILLHVVDISQSTQKRQTIGGITPSIWVNDQLWFLGSFSSEQFIARISPLIVDQDLIAPQ